MDALSRSVNLDESVEVPPICRKNTHVVGDKEERKENRGGANRGVEWTSEEDDKLKIHYPHGGMNACVDALPHRSQDSIYSRVRKLGLKYVRPSGVIDEPECHDAYMRRQDREFCRAMLAHPEERPSNYSQPRNGAGSRR